MTLTENDNDQIDNDQILNAIDQFIEAMYSNDTTVIQNLSRVVSMDEEYETVCICGCGDTVSIWKSLKNASCHENALRFMLISGIISIEKAIILLGELLEISGTINCVFDRVQADTLIDILFDFLTPYKERVVSHVNDEYNITIFHSVLYGYSDEIERWVNKMIDWNANPFAQVDGQTPFQLIIRNLYYDEMIRITTKYENINFDQFDLNPRMRNVNHLMYILWKYSRNKDEETIEIIHKLFYYLIERTDVSYVDTNGWNVSDYVIHYKWNVHSSLLPDPTRRIKQSRNIYNENPTVHAQFMLTNKYNRYNMNILVEEAKRIVEEHGLPNLFDRNDYEDIQNICNRTGFYYSPVNEIFQINNDRYEREVQERQN